MKCGLLMESFIIISYYLYCIMKQFLKGDYQYVSFTQNIQLASKNSIHQTRLLINFLVCIHVFIIFNIKIWDLHMYFMLK